MSKAGDLIRDPFIAKLVLFGTLGLAFNNPLWTDDKGAAKTLIDHGYSNVSTGGYAWRSGVGGYKTKYTATNEHGKVEHGAVVEGFILKGSTIKYEP
jgi:hypothetical protein